MKSKTNFTFWIFNWGVSETTYLINEYGDLMTRNKNYKFNLGGSANIWGNTD